MPAMRPYLTAGFLIAAGLAWGLRLGLDPEPFAPGPAGLVAVTAILAALIGGSGILLAGGHWAPRLGAATVAGQLALAAVMPFDAGGAVALSLSFSAAIAVLVSRAPTRQTRRAVPEIPAPAVVTVIGLIWVPAVAGVASPSAASPAHWLLAVAALGGAWTYTRARLAGLWMIRIALLPAAIWAAVASPLAGAVVLLGAAVFVIAASWTGGARRAADPLLRTRVPAPHPFAAAARTVRR